MIAYGDWDIIVIQGGNIVQLSAGDLHFMVQHKYIVDKGNVYRVRTDKTVERRKWVGRVRTDIRHDPHLGGFVLSEPKPPSRRDQRRRAIRSPE
jgi:hypothetical protein